MPDNKHLFPTPPPPDGSDLPVDKLLCYYAPFSAFCIDRDLRLRFANPAFFHFIKENFGITLEIGECALDLLSKSRRALWQSRLGEVFDGEFMRVEEVLESEYGTRYFDVIYQPVHQGEIVAMVLVYFEEITVRRRRELRLSETESQLRDSIRMRETLLSVISHDLRSPIFQLNGLLYNIRINSENRDEKRLQMHAEDLEERIAHLTHTLDNLLSWSNLNRNNLEPQVKGFALHSVCADAIGLLKPNAARKGVSIRSNIPKQLLLQSDRELVAFIIRNLINNAIKFSNEGGEISIECDKSARENRILVADTGIGIHAERLAILEQQHRLDSETGTWGELGTGLGLPLCYEFVNHLKGSLAIESQPGKGTRITVCLPDLG